MPKKKSKKKPKPPQYSEPRDFYDIGLGETDNFRDIHNAKWEDFNAKSPK